MTREEIMNSHTLMIEFSASIGVEPNTYEAPYFFDRLAALDPVYGCVEKFENFCNDLLPFENERAYDEYCAEIEKQIGQALCDNDVIRGLETGEEAFRTEKFETESGLEFGFFIEPTDDFPMEGYLGKNLVSVKLPDLRLHTLRKLFPDEYGDCYTFEQLVGRYTNMKQALNREFCKDIIIYDDLAMETELVEEFSETISDACGFEILNIYDHEIILDIAQNEKRLSENDVIAIVKCEAEKLDLVTEVKFFHVERVAHTDSKGFVRVYHDEVTPPKFIGLPEGMEHIYIKRYFGQPISQSDLLFSFDGKLGMLFTYQEGE